MGRGLKKTVRLMTRPRDIMSNSESPPFFIKSIATHLGRVRWTVQRRRYCRHGCFCQSPSRHVFRPF